MRLQSGRIGHARQQNPLKKELAMMRHLAAFGAAAGAVGVLLSASPDFPQTVAASGSISGDPNTAGQEISIRPFHANVSDEALADLRRRIAATRWPDRETVSDRS
jgi:hypothetical protein